MAPPTPEPSDIGLEPDGMRVDALAREILRDNYLHFHIKHIALDEDVGQGDVALKVSLEQSGSGTEITVEGRGVGLIDAFFDGVMRVFADEYPSLKTVTVSDFGVRPGFDGAQGRKSDALAVASLRMRNSEGAEFRFERATPSVTRSSVRVALDALTFIINSERAYVQLHKALKDATSRRRTDLVARYQTQMGTLVHATSYSEVIERLKKDK
jgi:hypothetical protein